MQYREYLLLQRQNGLTKDNLPEPGRLKRVHRRASISGESSVGVHRSGLDDTAPDGITHQASCFVNIQLLHESGTVRFGGFHAYSEQRGDVLGGMPFGNQLKHLPFAERQRI